MKNPIKITLILTLALLALCLTACVPDDAPIGENTGTEQDSGQSNAALGEIAFVLNEQGTSYTVTGIGTFTGTELVIPATYNDLPVTAIQNNAFEHCTQLTSVELPENLYIGDFAFSGCTGLKHITIPKGTTGLTRAFDACTGLESATLLSPCDNANYIFFNCSNLTHLEFGSDVYINASYWKLGLVSIGTADEWYDAGRFITVEPVLSYDEDGNPILDENGNEVVLHYDVLERLPITTITGGILGEGAGLIDFPSLAKLENYTVNGECITVDGVLIGCPDPLAKNYSIWWVDPKIESLNTANFYLYIGPPQIGLYLFAHCQNLKTIKTDPECISILREAASLTALTEIYYAGNIVDYLNGGGEYFGDGITIHCEDGVIPKELGAAIAYQADGSCANYKYLNEMYPHYLNDVNALIEYYEDYNTLLGNCSEAQYESYAEFADAAEGTNEYALYQEYLQYRSAKSRYATTRNRRINDLCRIYRCWESAQKSGADVATATDQFVNTALLMLESMFGCQIEYEQGKQGDLNAVTNLDQLPVFIQDRVTFFASLQNADVPQNPDEAFALFEDALNVAINTGCITKEEVYIRLGLQP